MEREYEYIAGGCESNIEESSRSAMKIIDLMREGGRIQPYDVVVIRFIRKEDCGYEVWRRNGTYSNSTKK